MFPFQQKTVFAFIAETTPCGLSRSHVRYCDFQHVALGKDKSMKSFVSAFAESLCLAAALVALSINPTHAAEPASKPNIIVIMGDDVGYGDVSCNGATAITTPNIDALAERGLRFTSGYCSASTCTPTRYSFLTGNYAFRKKGTGVAAPTLSLIHI